MSELGGYVFAFVLGVIVAGALFGLLGAHPLSQDEAFCFALGYQSEPYIGGGVACSETHWKSNTDGTNTQSTTFHYYTEREVNRMFYKEAGND